MSRPCARKIASKIACVNGPYGKLYQIPTLLVQVWYSDGQQYLLEFDSVVQVGRTEGVNSKKTCFRRTGTSVQGI